MKQNGLYFAGLLSTTQRKYFFEKALEIIKAGTAAILDWGFWKHTDRKEATDYFTKCGYAVEWHGIDIE